MKSLENLENFISLFIICLIINILPSFQILNRYEIKIPINQNVLSNFFFFSMYGKDYICDKWVPSLFNPILLVSYKVDIKYGKEIDVIHV